MRDWSFKRRRELGSLFILGAGILVACSVDTSDITFQKDDCFERENCVIDVGGVANGGGVPNVGGVVNIAGVLNKAGSGNGGGSTGGSKQMGGNNPGGAANGGVAGVGGGGGVGGGPPGNGYPCQERVRPDKLIADFSGSNDPVAPWEDGNKVVELSLYTFPTANSPPQLSLGDGALHAAVQKVDQPKGFGIAFSPCVEGKAAGFTGVAFNLWGARKDGKPLQLRVGVGINDNKAADPMRRMGACMPQGGNAGSCRPSVTDVEVKASAPPGAMVFVRFADLKDGSPQLIVDPTQLVSVEWGFIDVAPPYDAEVVIDDVIFQ